MIKTVMSCLFAVTKSENIIWDKKPHQDNSCICPCLLLFFGVQCLKCYILQTPILSVNLVFNKKRITIRDSWKMGK